MNSLGFEKSSLLCYVVKKYNRNVDIVRIHGYAPIWTGVTEPLRTRVYILDRLISTKRLTAASTGSLYMFPVFLLVFQGEGCTKTVQKVFFFSESYSSEYIQCRWLP